MSEPEGTHSIRFYFSFRSPYAWLAAERLDSELGDLSVSIEMIPIYPTPELFPNDPSALPEKAAYLIQDIPRLARERGLTVCFPSASDTGERHWRATLIGRYPTRRSSVRRSGWGASIHAGSVSQTILRRARRRR